MLPKRDDIHITNNAEMVEIHFYQYKLNEISKSNQKGILFKEKYYSVRVQLSVKKDLLVVT